MAALAAQAEGGLKVVANLPYYITTPIIMNLLEGGVPAESITVMIQKEVAERMAAGPGGKEYGALSLAVRYYAEPELIANVPPNCFIPRPAVSSVVIKLTLRKEPPVQMRTSAEKRWIWHSLQNWQTDCKSHPKKRGRENG